ncbi:MAG: hypothetical protein ACXW0F_10400, partial [Gaiellaceae bacterium]
FVDLVYRWGLDYCEWGIEWCARPASAGEDVKHATFSRDDGKSGLPAQPLARRAPQALTIRNKGLKQPVSYPILEGVT